MHIGQKVIRIIEWSATNQMWTGTPIEKGEIHIIRRIDRNFEALFFEGIPDRYNEYGDICGYTSCEFAPYNPPAEYIAVTFSDIKEPAPCAS